MRLGAAGRLRPRLREAIEFLRGGESGFSEFGFGARAARPVCQQAGRRHEENHSRASHEENVGIRESLRGILLHHDSVADPRADEASAVLAIRTSRAS